MTRSELVTRIAAENPNLPLSDVEKIVRTLFSTITEALSDGRRVELRDFGVFSIKHRGPRLGRNPRNGEPVDVEAKAVPYFKTGKELRDRLNGK